MTDKEIKKELQAKLAKGVYDYNLLNKYDYMNDFDIIPLREESVESQ